MEINGVNTYQPAQPAKPVAPTPPPGGNIENRQPPSEPSKPTSSTDTSTVNYSALRSLQEILNEYSDVSNLNKDKQVELTSLLQSSGLLEPGAIINATA